MRLDCKTWRPNNLFTVRFCFFILTSVLAKDKRILFLCRIEDTKVTSAGASFFFDKLRTENVKAKYVRLQDSPNVDDKCIKSIGEYIKTNKFVEIINLERDSITDAGIEALVPYLEGNTTFKGFYLSGNYRISDKSIPHFLKMIESSRMDTLFTIETSVSKQKQFVVPLARNVILSGSQEMALFGK